MQQFNVQLKYPSTVATERGRPSKIDSSTKYLVYCISNIVVVRHLDDLSKYSIFDSHKFDTTAVAISHSGNLCCSGDVRGNIIVWELNIYPHPIFKQYDDVLGGPIRDICWTGDGERLIVAGEGKTYFGKAFLLDSGSSVGEISGVSQTLHACTVRPTRPFRLIMGGDESSIFWYEGPPFKFKKSSKQHTNTIYAIKYNKGGDHFVTVGADKKIFLYDGKTGDLVKEITSNSPHTRSITGVSWINENTFITSSNDTTLKIWNFEGLVKTLKIANAQEFDDMQVGVTVNGNVAYSLSLTGALNVWKNVETIEDGPTHRLFGHNAPVGQMLTYGDSTITGDNNGRLLIWNEQQAIRPQGVHHTKQIISMSVSHKNLYSLGGEQIKLTNLETNVIEKTIDCKGLTLRIAASQTNPEICYVLMEDGVIIQFTNLEFAREYKLGYETSHFLVADDVFLVGDHKGKIHMINIESGNELETFQLQQTKITALALQGDRFLCGDTTGKIKLIDYKQRQVLFGDRWTHHTTIISSLNFTASGKNAVSTGFDNKIMIWNLESGQRISEQIDAHKRGVLTAVVLSNNKVLTSGGDNSLKEWSFNLE